MLCNPFNQSVGSNTTYLTCSFTLCGGNAVVAGVCATGGVYNGDTVLALYDSDGNQVAFNDDAISQPSCDVGSQISYTPIVTSSCGLYVLREYCYTGSECSGTVSVVITSLSAIPTYSPTGTITTDACMCITLYQQMFNAIIVRIFVRFLGSVSICSEAYFFCPSCKLLPVFN